MALRHICGCFSALPHICGSLPPGHRASHLEAADDIAKCLSPVTRPLGAIGGDIGFIEEPFDVFVEGQLLRAFDLQRLLSPFKIPFAVLGGATSLQAGFILERGDNTLRLTLLYAYKIG